MIKLSNTKIVFNSTLEHRLIERARYHLKQKGIEDIKTISHNNFSWIMEGIFGGFYIKEIHILMRKVDSNRVAMNRDDYEFTRRKNKNPLLILVDRRHMYPVKFLWFNNINEREYKDLPVPHVLIPEADFRDISEMTI